VKLVLGVLCLVAIASVVYVYRAKIELSGSGRAPGNGATSQLSSSPAPAQIDWQEVDRSPDGFKVQMPTGANETLIPAYNAQGGVEQVNLIMAMPGPDTFAVAWADHPPVERASSENAEKTLDLARDGALARTETVLTGEARSRIDGYPECQFSARNEQGGIMNARLILAGTHLYMLTAAFPAASARREEDVNRFFDSFMLTPASASD
jgi:hypothetical protein